MVDAKQPGHRDCFQQTRGPFRWLTRFEGRFPCSSGIPPLKNVSWPNKHERTRTTLWGEGNVFGRSHILRYIRDLLLGSPWLIYGLSSPVKSPPFVSNLRSRLSTALHSRSSLGCRSALLAESGKFQYWQYRMYHFIFSWWNVNTSFFWMKQIKIALLDP